MIKSGLPGISLLPVYKYHAAGEKEYMFTCCNRPFIFTGNPDPDNDHQNTFNDFVEGYKSCNQLPACPIKLILNLIAFPDLLLTGLLLNSRDMVLRSVYTPASAFTGVTLSFYP